MLPNMHPADELSLVRSEMRKLRAREQELCDGFGSGQFTRDGTIARVNLSVKSRRRFQRELLPPEITDDPRYWQLRHSQVVQIEDRSLEWVEDPDLDADEVIEPFDA